jgi:hypothetical protein
MRRKAESSEGGPAETQRRVAEPVGRLSTIRLGGAEGHELLTCAIAIVLSVLLALEGLTVVHMTGLVSEHMFLGIVLIPPLALKLGSTGYRAVRYYTRSRPYRALGPPRLPLRLLAPPLVASTLGLFATGVMLLIAGHKSNTLLEVHKVSFIVFVVLFIPHFVAYVPRVVRSPRMDWREVGRGAVPGSGLRAMMVALAVGGGAALALSVLNAIHAWRA